jgi:hypothetical protein
MPLEIAQKRMMPSSTLLKNYVVGNEALHSWANNAALKAAEVLCNQEVNIHKNGKKKSAGTRRSEKSRF